MNERHRFSHELGPYVDADEANAIDAVAELLETERPRPSAAFRAHVRGRLSELGRQRVRWQPRRPAVLALSYMGSGLTLLAVAAIGLADLGPLAY